MFAATKVQPPQLRRNLVTRTALLARLIQALCSVPLVLLSAAAGYGKTYLLAQALAKLPDDVVRAWVRAEPHDDVHSIVAGLVAALDPSDPPWRIAPAALQALLLEPDGPRRVAIELLHGLTGIAQDKGVIALDHLHAVQDPRLYDLLATLIAAMPPGWSLAIATRVDPPLRLARLRAQGGLVEFRPTDLRFSADEVRELTELWPANASGPAMDQQAVSTRLLSDTGGWVAGMCLELMSWSAGSTPPSRRSSRRQLFEYLGSEVLADLPTGLRSFLIRCAVLSEWTPNRCKALTGDPLSAAWIEEIERRELFCSTMEGPELTIRPVELFRGFLQDRLLAEMPDELPELTRRAARLESDLVRQVEMLLHAGAWLEAEDVLCEAAAAIHSGDKAQVARLTERFPETMRAASPSLAYMRGLIALPNLFADILASSMAAAAQGFAARRNLLMADRARAYLALGLFYAGRVDEAVRLAESLRQPRPWDPEVQALLILLDHLVEFVQGSRETSAAHLGRLADALRGAPPELWFRCLSAIVPGPGLRPALDHLLEEAVAAAGEEHLHLRTSAQFHQLTLMVYEARVDAIDPLLKALEEDYAWQSGTVQRRMAFLRSLLGQLRGEDIHSVADIVRSNIAVAPPRPALLRNGSLNHARLCAASGDWDTVRYALQKEQEAGGFPEGPPVRFSPVALQARLALHEGVPAKARALLLPLSGGWEQDRVGQATFTRITLAVAHLRCGDHPAAWQALKEVIIHVARTRHLSNLVTAGLDQIEELLAAPWGEQAEGSLLAVLRQWIWQLQAIRRPLPARPTAPRTHSQSDLGLFIPTDGRADKALALEGLTPREIEVLQRLASGDSNKVIAQALELSPNTVKRHVARILDRLGVSSRGEAANMYRTSATSGRFSGGRRA